MADERRRTVIVSVLAIIAASGCFLFDLATPAGFAAGVPYIVVVMAAIWLPWPFAPFALGILGTLLTGLGSLLSPTDGIASIEYTNRALAIAAIWVAVFLVLGRLMRDKALREGENLASTVISTAPNGIIVNDENGIVRIYNPACEKLFGYAASEVVGNNVNMILPPSDEDKPDDFRRRQLTAKDKWINSLTSGVMARRKYGSTFPISISVSAADYAGREMFVTIIRDLTDIEMLEAARSKSSEMAAAGPLTSGVAHDLNNLLLPIAIFTQSVRDSLEPENPHRDSLDKALLAIRRARELVAQLRTRPFQRRPVRLDEVIVESVAFLRAGLPDGIEIHTRLDAGPATILADPTQIQEVILNIGTNAVQAMEGRTGTVQFSLDILEITEDEELNVGATTLDPGRYARLTVSDPGCGMNQAILDRIFEPYFTTRSAGDGAGMGLAVAAQITSSHGGAIAVSSEPDNGSEFEIYLPMIENG